MLIYMSTHFTMVILSAPPSSLHPSLLQGHTERIWSVAFSPDGRQLATGSDDNTARVWDLSTGETIVLLKVCTLRPTSRGRGSTWIPGGKAGR